MKEMIYMADIKYEIKETVGSLSENNKGWSKELNLISWNTIEEATTSKNMEPTLTHTIQKETSLQER